MKKMLILFMIVSSYCFSQGEIYKLGDYGPAGGIIFYDKGNWDDDWRYLEVWTSDESDRNYGCHFDHDTSDEIGGGYLNSRYMSDSCNNYNQSYYMISHGGKRGWHIPSRYESDSLYDFKINFSEIDLNFQNKWYWTSSDRDYYAYAWQKHFGNGNTRSEGMQYSFPVRLIRQVTINDVQERTNKSLHLDGENFFTVSPTAIYQAINQNSYKRSIGFWIYPQESGVITSMYENDNSNDSDFLIRYNGDTDQIEFIGDGRTPISGYNTAEFGNLPENQWYHVYMVINNGNDGTFDLYTDGERGTLYAWVNGVRQDFQNGNNTIDVSITTNVNYLPLYLGGFQGSVSTFKGYIDDFTIWGEITTTRGLSTNEVNSVFTYPPIQDQNRMNTAFDFNVKNSNIIDDISYRDYTLESNQYFELSDEVPYNYDYKPLNLGFDYQNFIYNNEIQVDNSSLLVGEISVFDPNTDSSEITLSIDEDYGDIADFNLDGSTLYFNEGFNLVGNYVIKVIANDGNNQLIKELRITVNEDSLTNKNLTNLGGISIYPNPTNNILNIDFNDYKSSELFSIDGKSVLKSTLKQIDISNKVKGIYFLVIEDVNGRKSKGIKVIKE